MLLVEGSFHKHRRSGMCRQHQDEREFLGVIVQLLAPPTTRVCRWRRVFIGSRVAIAVNAANSPRGTGA